MIIKVYRIIMAVLLIISVVASDEIPRRSLRQTAQVSGIALDRQGDQIKATFELYDPAVDDPIGEKQKTVFGVGESIEACIIDASKRQGGELFIDDASALIIEGENRMFIVSRILEYYRELKHDHMDLKVFVAENQRAEAVFEGAKSVISAGLSKSAENLNAILTVKDLMNNQNNWVKIKGEGSYEIVS